MALGVEDGRVIDVRPLRFLADPERLTTPLVRRGGRLEPVAWKTALEAAVAALGTAQQVRDGPVFSYAELRRLPDAFLALEQPPAVAAAVC